MPRQLRTEAEYSSLLSGSRVKSSEESRRYWGAVTTMMRECARMWAAPFLRPFDEETCQIAITYLSCGTRTFASRKWPKWLAANVFSKPAATHMMR